MRARVPQGIKNDIPMFFLTNDQWIIFAISFVGVISSASTGAYELIPLFLIAGGYLMFRRINGEKPWVVWYRKFYFKRRSKIVVRKGGKGYFGFKK